MNQHKVERRLFFQIIPEMMFASVSFVSLRGVSPRFHGFACSAAFGAMTHVLGQRASDGCFGSNNSEGCSEV